VSRRRVHYSTFKVDVCHLRYWAVCRITLGRAPSHDGPDGVHYLDPGLPAALEIIRVRRDGIQVTPDKDLKAELLSRCSRMAGVPRVSMPVRKEQAALEFMA
jgi:hypothetical protein